MSTTRKKPFSSKKKKEQLKLKREKIRAQGNWILSIKEIFEILLFILGDKWADSDDDSGTIDRNSLHNSRRRINEQPVRDGTLYNPNR
jgi:hypothetical protein